MITGENYRQYQDTIERWLKDKKTDESTGLTGIQRYLRPDSTRKQFVEDWEHWSWKTQMEEKLNHKDPDSLAKALVALLKRYLTDQGLFRLEDNIRMQDYRRLQQQREQPEEGQIVRVLVADQERTKLNQLASELKTSVAEVVKLNLVHLEEGAIQKHKSMAYLLKQVQKRVNKRKASES